MAVGLIVFGIPLLTLAALVIAFIALSIHAWRVDSRLLEHLGANEPGWPGTGRRGIRAWIRHPPAEFAHPQTELMLRQARYIHRYRLLALAVALLLLLGLGMLLTGAIWVFSRVSS